MDNDEEAMDTESEMKLISREWERRSKARYKEGFLQGSTEAQNHSIQKGFNAGFKQGFLSNFLLSKMKGLLNALIAYQVSYEGHPITDSTILEAHALLEEIHSLEVNSVAEDFIKLSLDQNRVPKLLPDGIVQNLSAISTNLRGNEPLKNSIMCEDAGASDFEPDNKASEIDPNMVNSLNIERINSILRSCPAISNAINRCKSILKSLNWTDEMIDGLL